MKTKFLIVDDWESRHARIAKTILSGCVGAELRHRRTPDDVCDDDLKWAHVVFLDHDMCTKHDEFDDCPNALSQAVSENFLDPYCGCKTGLALVNRMLQDGLVSKDITYVIHTGNQVGARKMFDKLSDVADGINVVVSPATAWDYNTNEMLCNSWRVMPYEL